MSAACAPSWTATVLPTRPLILPKRHFVYPAQVDEVERGALEVLVRPAAADAFLATCALGFAGGLSGIWPCPHPDRLCAIAGGYAYLIDTQHPERWEQVACRPVLAVLAAPARLLFVGHRTIEAYGAAGWEWESPALSSEGIEELRIKGDRLYGTGWDLRTDLAVPFALCLRTGQLLARGVSE